MNAYLTLYQSEETGLLIIGLYLNKKAAIRSAMRKVYQLMDIKTIKIEGEWVWADHGSVISVNEMPIVDFKDLNGDSPIPHFLRYQEYLQDIPKEELEKLRNQSLNRKKLLDRISGKSKN